MPQCGFATCSDCNFRLDLVEGWFGVEGLYRISESETLPVIAAWTWCPTCASITQMERLPSIREINDEIRRSHWFSTGWGNDYWRSTRALHDPISRRQHLKLMRCMLRWRIERTSQPRCLGCGDETCDPILENGTTLHPNCGGNIKLELGSIWTGIFEYYHSYSPNGVQNGVYGLSSDTNELTFFRDRDIMQQLSNRNVAT